MAWWIAEKGSPPESLGLRRRLAVLLQAVATFRSQRERSMTHS